MVLEGSPELVLPNIVDRFSIDHVTTSFTPGWYEKQAIAFLEQKLPATLSVFRGSTLFDAEQFPLRDGRFTRYVLAVSAQGGKTQYQQSPGSTEHACHRRPRRNLTRFPEQRPRPTPACRSPAGAPPGSGASISFCFTPMPSRTISKPAMISMA
jgi:deoxyribodipyrimidine photo-lyase